MNNKSLYEKYVKRLLDITLSFLGIVILSPILIIVAVLVRFKIGSPVFFIQERPGLKGNIFKMYKFRTMTDEKDESGNILPDDERLTKFGKLLRSTSLDELPELFNILKGDMSIVGPRPQLVRDMVFMSEKENMRHNVMPGLTGLAQISGRNAISWEDKFKYDLIYIKDITFLNDLKIFVKTIAKVFKREDISSEGMETAEDYGDYLLRTKRINKTEYNALLKKSEDLINEINITN